MLENKIIKKIKLNNMSKQKELKKKRMMIKLHRKKMKDEIVKKNSIQNII
jgi:hypothetical protein